MRLIDEHYFHDGVSSTGNGTPYKTTADGSTITFSIKGDSSSRTLVFEASVNGTEYYAIKCANLTTLSLATQTTGNDELWQVDITGLHSFRVRVSAISGGDVTVLGRVVDA